MGTRNAVDVPELSGTSFAFRSPMNAIELLKAQHKKTKANLEKGSKGKLDAAEAKQAADELVAHMVIEEHVFYPRIRELMKDPRRRVLRGAHHGALRARALPHGAR